MGDTFGDFMIGNAATANKRIVELEEKLKLSEARLVVTNSSFLRESDKYQAAALASMLLTDACHGALSLLQRWAEIQGVGYDWNADPEALTLRTSNTIRDLLKALAEPFRVKPLAIRERRTVLICCCKCMAETHAQCADCGSPICDDSQCYDLHTCVGSERQS